MLYICTVNRGETEAQKSKVALSSNPVINNTNILVYIIIYNVINRCKHLLT